MANRIPRRQFVQQTAIGLGMAAVGSTLAWWALAPAEPTLGRTPSGDLLETVSRGRLPSFARKGGPKIEEVYHYAANNSDTLQYIPCFCGCEHVGHRSNADCYVAERFPDGRITFTSHGGK
jgi:hypothetical protein